MHHFGFAKMSLDKNCVIQKRFYSLILFQTRYEKHAVLSADRCLRQQTKEQRMAIDKLEIVCYYAKDVDQTSE